VTTDGTLFPDIWSTATRALGNVEDYATSIPDQDLASGTANEIARLRNRVGHTPKGLRWRTHANRQPARWYETSRRSRRLASREAPPRRVHNTREV